MRLFNRGGGKSGVPANDGERVVGETDRLAGSIGTVIEKTSHFGQEALTVTWTEGPRAGITEVVAQWEVGGTNM
jgi:hypothetical protein